MSTIYGRGPSDFINVEAYHRAMRSAVASSKAGLRAEDLGDLTEDVGIVEIWNVNDMRDGQPLETHRLYSNGSRKAIVAIEEAGRGDSFGILHHIFGVYVLPVEEYSTEPLTSKSTPEADSLEYNVSEPPSVVD